MATTTTAQTLIVFENNGCVYKVLDDDKATCALIGGKIFDNATSGDAQWKRLPTTVYFDLNKKEYTVTEIGDTAFKDKSATGTIMERIEFPERLESIGEEAFAGTIVRRVRFPKTLKTIGARAFENSQCMGCNLPDNMEQIGDLAFANFKLSDGFSANMNRMPEGIQIGNGNLKFGNAVFAGNIPEFVSLSTTSNTLSLDSVTTVAQGKPIKLYTLYNKEKTILKLITSYRIRYMEGTLNLSPDSISVEYHVPEGVARIEDYAFTGESYYNSLYWTWRLNGGVSRIYIPESVTYLGKYSLAGVGGGDIIFEGDMPPEMPEPAFFTGSDIQDGARLYARKEAIDAFKASEQWAAYEILPIEYVGIDQIETDNPDDYINGQDNARYPVYDLYGRIVMKDASIDNLMNLGKGIYIYNGKKIFR